MKKSKLILELSFLVLSSLLFISSKSIKNETDKISNIAIVDFHSLNEEKLKTIFFTINVKGLLSLDIKQDNSFALALNMDINDDAIADEVVMIVPQKGRMYFYGPFTGEVSQKFFVYNSDTLLGNVLITPIYSEPITSVDSGLKLYAGIKSQEESSLLDYFGYSIFNSYVKNVSNDKVTNIILELPKNILSNKNVHSFKSWIEIKRLQ